MKRQRASDRSVKEPKLSRAHPPVGLAPADWQRALRRQFGRDQAFTLENRGATDWIAPIIVSLPRLLLILLKKRFWRWRRTSAHALGTTSSRKGEARP